MKNMTSTTPQRSEKASLEFVNHQRSASGMRNKTDRISNVRRKIGRLITDKSRRRQLFLFHLWSLPFRLRLRHLWPSTYLGFVPDRYTINRGLYLAQGGIGMPWNERDFLHGNALNNGGDLNRWYFLHLVCDQILEEGLVGDIAELGVYKGNTAGLLSRLAHRLGRTAYLLDTFEGFSSKDFKGVDALQSAGYSDTSIEAVRPLVVCESVVFVKGFFPETADQLPDAASYVLVHLDCDLYAPMKAGLEYFYSRLTPGGFIIIHDYSSLCWAGPKRAVDEFFRDKPERVVPIPDKSGTVVIRTAGRS